MKRMTKAHNEITKNFIKINRKTVNKSIIKITLPYSNWLVK